MDYQIPQFVDEETKFVWILTLTQFWFILGAGALSLFVWLLVSSVFLKMLLIFIFFTIALTLALAKINGLPLYTLIIAAIRHLWLPKYYFWNKIIDQGNKQKNTPKIQKNIPVIKPQVFQKTFSSENISQIAKALDIKKRTYQP